MKKKSDNRKVQQIILLVYFGMMLGFFPLLYRFQYQSMGNFKYKVFKETTLLFCVMTGITVIFELFKELKGSSEKWHWTGLEKILLLFLGWNGVSCLASVDKSQALWGSGGWFMGFFTVLLLTGSFFSTGKLLNDCNRPDDRGKKSGNDAAMCGINILLISSFFVFLIGVLHRFDIDPIGVYGNLPDKYKVEFLSTIGQSSWYSSFLCTVWPIGLYLFYLEKQTVRRVLYGIYTVVGALSLVSQNTDTAFLSLMTVFLFLYFLCQKDTDGRKRFLECVLLVLLSFAGMGLLQRLFSDRMIPLEKISIFMSQSKLTAVLLVLTFAVYTGWQLIEHSKNCVLKKGLKKLDEFLCMRGFFYTILAICVLFCVATAAFIILNTTGVLQNCFDIQVKNSFLFFDEKWGNLRGFIWKTTVEYFRQLPPLRKFIGVGPDCYSCYYEILPEISDKINHFFHDLSLTNAHNEYLTKIIDLGIVGLIIYGSVFVTAIKEFLQERTNNSLMGCFILVVVSYCVHNIFCYEQVCSTSIFYILIAIGNSFVHNGKRSFMNRDKNKKREKS